VNFIIYFISIIIILFSSCYSP